MRRFKNPFKIEPDREFVAHDEKLIFSKFRPKIPYGELRNVVGFFLEIFLLTPQKKKLLMPQVFGKRPKINVQHTFH